MDSHRTADVGAPEAGTGGPERAALDGEQPPRQDGEQRPRIVARASCDLGPRTDRSGGDGPQRGVSERDGRDDWIPGSGAPLRRPHDIRR